MYTAGFLLTFHYTNPKIICIAIKTLEIQLFAIYPLERNF